MRTLLNEEEQVYSEQHAKELLAIQANYNKKLEQLNTELAKQKSDLMIKHMKLAQQQAATNKLKQKTEVEPEQKSIAKTGNVDTAGNPVTSKGGTPAVESISILRVNPIDEDEQVRYGNPYVKSDMRNWYQKPPTGGHPEEKPKVKRKPSMTYKRKMQIQDLQYEIQDFKDEIKWTKEKFQTPTYEGIEGEIENFFGEIGPEASEILNSGAYKSDAEIIQALKDVGVKDAKETLENYYYYYPEYNPKLAVERRKSREQIRKLELEIQKRQDKIDKMYSMYESTFSTQGVNDEEYHELKNYLDAENISYFEDEDGTEIDFDDTELDAEWQDRLEEIGLEYVRDFEEDEPKTNDILSVEDEDQYDEEDITDTDEKIDNEKVFYVKVEDEGEAFVGKIYKLFDEGDWRSKIVDGESETFEKLNYDPDWDEFDIIAFLRENYADAELVSEDDFNDHVEEPEVEPEEELEESLNERISSRGKFKKIWRYGDIWWRNNKKIVEVKHIEGPEYELTFEDGSKTTEYEGTGIGFSTLNFLRNFEEVEESWAAAARIAAPIVKKGVEAAAVKLGMNVADKLTGTKVEETDEEEPPKTHKIPTLDEYLDEASKSLPDEYPNKGDQFEILAEYWPGNPHNHLSLALGTSVNDRSGKDKYEFKIGDLITYISDNQWDTSFWKISDGREGRIFALPKSLVKNKILKKIRQKFYR